MNRQLSPVNFVPRLLRRAGRRLYRAYELWCEDDASLMAAAVAYYTALSFFPLLLILVAGLGLFLQWTALGQNAEEQVMATIEEYASPTVRRHVQTAFRQIQQNAAVSGPIGAAALLIAALTTFAHLQRSFDRIWHVGDEEDRGLLGFLRDVAVYRLKAFVMLICVAALSFLTFVGGVILAGLATSAQRVVPVPEWLTTGTDTALSVAINAVLFALIYRMLPRVPPNWADALRGGAAAAVIWEIGRKLLTFFLIGNRYSSAYGIIGSFLALMLWAYYACAVLFYGAEWIRAVQEERRRSDL